MTIIPVKNNEIDETKYDTNIAFSKYHLIFTQKL